MSLFLIMSKSVPIQLLIVAIDSTIIDNNVKIDNQVQIAHNVEIGENTAIACVK